MKLLVIAIAMLSLSCFGCSGSNDEGKVMTAAKTADQQIDEINARNDMPEDVKQRTIEGIRAGNQNGGRK